MLRGRAGGETMGLLEQAESRSLGQRWLGGRLWPTDSPHRLQAPNHTERLSVCASSGFPPPLLTVLLPCSCPRGTALTCSKHAPAHLGRPRAKRGDEAWNAAWEKAGRLGSGPMAEGTGRSCGRNQGGSPEWGGELRQKNGPRHCSGGGRGRERKLTRRTHKQAGPPAL